MRKIFALLIVILLTQSSYGQYTHWVFEGAGIRGIAYVGAVKEVNKTNPISEVKAFGGSSAGAITACLLALNYTPDEMEKILMDMDMSRFNDNKIPLISGLRNMNRSFGWYEGKKFEDWLQEKIKEKTGNAHSTFMDLHQNPAFKDLYVQATSLSDQKGIQFCFENYPDMAIADAVRISMSVPLYFKAICIDDKGNVLDKQDMRNGHWVVDGGLSQNYPTDIFHVQRENILGFKIERDEQIQKIRKKEKGVAPYPVKDLRSFIFSIYNLVMENKENKAHNESIRTIYISDGNIGPRVRKLSKQKILTLLNNGKKGVERFLN